MTTRDVVPGAVYRDALAQLQAALLGVLGGLLALFCGVLARAAWGRCK